MLRKICTAVLVAVIVMVMSVSAVLAVEAGQERVTIGANLSEKQINQIYQDFGLTRGDVIELVVTNDEEREYLSGLVPDEKIGTRAISCIYIETREEGFGIEVTTKKINWCTERMYINALLTAGVEDAKVMVSAPFEVSGTAALTGVYKAYEDITGVELDKSAKEAGAEELVVTGELAEIIGSEQAAELINELKKVLDQTKDMTDAELRGLILKIAAEQNVQLTEENIAQIISLVRTLEKLDIEDWAQKLSQLSQTSQDVSSFFDGVKDFFAGVGDFFANVFGDIGGFFSNLFGGR